MLLVEIASDDAFRNALAAHPVTVVKFGAPWCGPCRTMEKAIRENVAPRYDANEVAFYEANIDCAELAPLCDELGVVSVPMTFVFANGQLCRSPLLGANPGVLIADINAALHESRSRRT